MDSKNISALISIAIAFVMYLTAMHFLFKEPLSAQLIFEGLIGAGIIFLVLQGRNRSRK
ncbi:MAG: hypothetical protein R2792_11280 [Saprospiraceae bacterium]|jgi:drug/metabolite transporter (DMT)-like permease